jgi:DNA-binding GntR family transcriptional regulator
MQEIVYETIKDRVLRRQYQPGQRLNTNDLSAELGVSRMPVREALQRLEAATGLIRLIPHKGAVVRDSSLEDLCDVFRIRIVLEGLATRLACAHLGSAELEQMEELNRRIQKLSDQGGEDDFEQLNLDLHSIIWNASKNPRLITMVSSLYDASRSYRYASVKLPGRLDEIAREHRQILRALRKRDAGLAEKTVNKHYENTLQWLVRAQQENGQPDRQAQAASR